MSSASNRSKKAWATKGAPVETRHSPSSPNPEPTSFVGAVYYDPIRKRAMRLSSDGIVQVPAVRIEV